jgi:SAM-dependent methyltransferase
MADPRTKASQDGPAPETKQPGGSEGFTPRPHAPPSGLAARLRYSARLLADFQVRTVHAHVKAFLSGLSGSVLDLGCGEGPYRHLLGAGARYIGVDFEGSGHFEYAGVPDVIHYDGKKLPFDTASIDHVLCTEVLEHCPAPDQIVREIHRVLRPGGTALFTVPWSARYHYIPHDYFRYTPSKLEMLFKDFPSVRIEPRGTDLTSIASKLMVFALRPLMGVGRGPLAVPLAGALSPLAAGALAAGHLSLVFKIGSPDDPLGYTVWLTR